MIYIYAVNTYDPGGYTTRKIIYEISRALPKISRVAIIAIAIIAIAIIAIAIIAIAIIAIAIIAIAIIAIL